MEEIIEEEVKSAVKVIELSDIVEFLRDAEMEFVFYQRLIEYQYHPRKRADDSDEESAIDLLLHSSVHQGGEEGEEKPEAEGK